MLDYIFAEFLADAYSFKEIADYGLDPRVIVTKGEAKDMIDLAARFIDVIEQILA